MPHPVRPFPVPYDNPCFDSGRGDAADRDCRHEAHDRPAACRMCSRIRLCPLQAGSARRKWAGVRRAGARGLRRGSIRAFRRLRVVLRPPLLPASPLLPPGGRPPRPLETRSRRYLVAGG